MADASANRPKRSTTAAIVPQAPTHPAREPAHPDPIEVARSFQSAVFRLRWTLLAMKLAADGELENPHQERLFWPDLMDALVALTPAADALDLVVDKLRRE